MRVRGSGVAGQACGAGIATEVWSSRGVLSAGCRVDDLGFGWRVQPGGKRKKGGVLDQARGLVA